MWIMHECERCPFFSVAVLCNVFIWNLHSIRLRMMVVWNVWTGLIGLPESSSFPRNLSKQLILVPCISHLLIWKRCLNSRLISLQNYDEKSWSSRVLGWVIFLFRSIFTQKQIKKRKTLGLRNPEILFSTLSSFYFWVSCFSSVNWISTFFSFLLGSHCFSPAVLFCSTHLDAC